VLGAVLFLIQRGVQSGVTIYAPAIILSTVLGWSLNLTIIFIGVLVVVYTVTGGSAAVNLTQKWQMGVIFGGMVAAFVVVVTKLPDHALPLAGAMGKLEGVDFSLDPDRRYTFWSGLFGGLFLQLSYFGTDQSQVQRYIGGAALREGRLGLMFNALLKIPMQFFILLLGVLVFVFYQFEADTPVFFNRVEWVRVATRPIGGHVSCARGAARGCCTERNRNGFTTGQPPGRRVNPRRRRRRESGWSRCNGRWRQCGPMRKRRCSRRILPRRPRIPITFSLASSSRSSPMVSWGCWWR
jgi:hypothetical protein